MIVLNVFHIVVNKDHYSNFFFKEYLVFGAIGFDTSKSQW